MSHPSFVTSSYLRVLKHHQDDGSSGNSLLCRESLGNLRLCRELLGERSGLLRSLGGRSVLAYVKQELGVRFLALHEKLGRMQEYRVLLIWLAS